MPEKTPLTYTYVKLQRRIITPVYLYGVSALTPKDTVTNALWDTGATFSAITPRIQHELKLTPIGSKLIRGVTGTQKAPVVMITLTLPNDLLKQNIEVAVCDFSHDIGMLIGMDIITQGDFVLLHGNSHTEFSFTIPPR
jgi:predicted aspartyl protease